VFATGVFTPHLIQKLEEECDYDVICYLPKYRSNFPLVNVDRSRVRFVWGPLSYPFSLFKSLRRDRRQVVVIPLEQRTMGPTVFSLLLLPLFLAICRFSGMKIVINLQGLLPLGEFSTALDTLVPNTKVPKRFVKVGIFSIYNLIFSTANRIQVFAKTFGVWVQQYGKFGEKIQLVKFGVQRPSPKSCTSSRPQFLDCDYVLAYGYVVPRKGLEVLVDAWIEVHSKYKKTLLVIAGSTDKDPAFANRLKQRIKNANLGDSVLLTGYVSSLEEWQLFEGCTCAVFPYLFSDSFSGPLCTALACRVPIVAAKVGFFADLFANGGSLLYSPKDVHSLTQTLLDLLDSKELRNKLRLESEVVASSLDWDLVGAEYCRFINEALSS
jgi:glycosyltransferase involved in cell wall biosynthesis